MPEGISTVDTNSLALEMVGRKFKKAKSIRASANPWFIKLIDGELWICQRDGLSVYDTALALVRGIDTSQVFDFALLPRGNVVITGKSLCEMPKSGTEMN